MTRKETEAKQKNLFAWGNLDIFSDEDGKQSKQFIAAWF